MKNLLLILFAAVAQHCFCQRDTITYHENGEVSMLRSYEPNTKVQTSFYHYSNGVLRYVEQMKNNKLHGQIIEYYQNGRIKLKEYYINGKEHGEFIQWSENGEVINITIYDAGVDLNSSDKYPLLYDENGHLKCDTNYKVENIATFPVFQNNESALIRLLTSEIKYPLEATRNGLQGIVILNITLVKDSSDIYKTGEISLANDKVSIISNDVLKQVETLLADKRFISQTEEVDKDNLIFFIPFYFKIEVDKGSCNSFATYLNNGCLTYLYYSCSIKTHGN